MKTPTIPSTDPKANSLTEPFLRLADVATHARSAGLSPLERQAGELLAKLPPVVPLSPEARSKIGAATKKPTGFSIQRVFGGAGLVTATVAFFVWSFRAKEPSVPLRSEPAASVERVAVSPPQGSMATQETAGLANRR